MIKSVSKLDAVDPLVKIKSMEKIKDMIVSKYYQNIVLEGTVPREFCCWVFHQTDPHNPNRDGLGPFRFFAILLIIFSFVEFVNNINMYTTKKSSNNH